MAENATAETEPQHDDSEGTPLEVYEWGGGIVAGLGFFMTPLLTGLPALYCAMKIREEKPLASLGIGLVIAATAVFWAGFLFADDLMSVIVQGGVLAILPLAVLLLVVVVIPGSVLLVLFLMRR